MARYAVTAVFEVGAGKVPRGPDVLERLVLPDRAVHRFSYCDGRTLTAVVDWRGGDAATACLDAALGVRLAWSRITGADPGMPVSVRVRPLGLPARVSAGIRRRPEYVWSPHGGPTGRLVPIDPGQVVPRPGDWDGPDDPDDPDDGGLAGVREPRRPKPGPGHLFAEREQPQRPPA